MRKFGKVLNSQLGILTLNNRWSIASLFFLSLFINVITLHGGHSWGDDFAQYIINARNIIEGKNYMHGIMADNPCVYPPGFPLLLAPLIKLFGINFKVLKSVNIIFWYPSLLLIYSILVRSTSNKTMALMSCLFLAFSSFFFLFKQCILSGIPFLFFICASFNAIDRWKDYVQAGDRGQYREFVLFLVLASCAFWIRGIGIVLFMTGLLYFSAFEYKPRPLAYVFLAGLANVVIQMGFMSKPDGEIMSVYRHFWNYFGISLKTAHIVFLSIVNFMCPPANKISGLVLQFSDYWGEFLATGLFFTGVWYFVVQVRKRTLSFLECFSMIYIVLAMFWTAILIPLDAFTRYILPLTPVLFIWMWKLSNYLIGMCLQKGFRHPFITKIPKIIFLSLFFLNILNIGCCFNFKFDALYTKETRELTQWVRDNISINEYFMFNKPCALSLLTGRMGTTPLLERDNDQTLLERVKKLNISYLILFKESQQLKSCQQRHFALVWQNNDFQVYRYIGSPLI